MLDNLILLEVQFLLIQIFMTVADYYIYNFSGRPSLHTCDVKDISWSIFLMTYVIYCDYSGSRYNDPYILQNYRLTYLLLVLFDKQIMFRLPRTEHRNFKSYGKLSLKEERLLKVR